MADDRGFRGRYEPSVLESERRALAMVRVLQSGVDGVVAPIDFGPLDAIMDELYELDVDAVTDVVMALAQMVLEFGADLHGVDRFGEVLTAREVEHAGRVERSAAGAGLGPVPVPVIDIAGGRR